MDNSRQIKAAMAPLFAALMRRNASEIDAGAALAIYVQDLSDLPVAAVEQVCSSFRRGVIGDGVWCPTSAQIRQEALKVADRMDRLAPPEVAFLTDERALKDIARQARHIAENHGLSEFTMQTEWRKFRAWMGSLGPTQQRWDEEWPKWVESVQKETNPIGPEDDLREVLR